MNNTVVRNLPVMALAIFGLSACALVSAKAPKGAPPVNLGKYHFEYAIENKERTRMVQVFDDGTKTYFQFLDANVIRPLIFTEEERLIPYELEHNYIVVPGVHKSFTVVASKSRSTVKNLSTPPGLGVAAATLPLSVETKPDIEAAAPAVTEPQPTAVTAETPRPIETQTVVAPATQSAPSLSDSRKPKQYQVPFATKTASLGPQGREAVACLLLQASNAEQVIIRGRAFGPDIEAAKKLALSRAISIKRELVKGGVGAGKIRLFYSGIRKTHGVELSLLNKET